MAVEPAPNLPIPKIADHELLRCIGKGSFGQVWLARNVMGEYRAVKIVYRAAFETDRPLTQEFEAIKKYEPKSRSHPSLLNILHVGRNTADEYFYYIMELADNQTTEQPLDAEHYEAKTLLSEFKSKKRLPVDECIQIGLALTEALDYLHQNRLVHRDIKLSNVIFVGGRPQLADVGLVTNIDGTKSYVGTEGYIPPGGPGSVQADVYALGKVLYEISTGNSRLDFPTIPLVGADATERKQFLALNDVFLKACNHDLKKRYKTAKEMHAALILAKKDPKPPRLPLGKLLLGVALVAVAGIIFARMYLPLPRNRFRPIASNQKAPAPQLRPTVAIFEFDDNTTDDSLHIWRKGLRDFLATDLAQTKKLQVVERSRLQDLLNEHQLTKSHFIDPSTAVQLGKGLAAQWVIVGSFLVFADEVRIDARMISVEKGIVEVADSVRGPKQNFLDLEKALAEKLLLTVESTPALSTLEAVRRAHTTNLEAFTVYSQALIALDAGDVSTTHSLLQRAVQLDPQFLIATKALTKLPTTQQAK